jgi:DNA recombination protein RmuC
MQILYCSLAFVAGAVLTWLLLKLRLQAQQAALIERSAAAERNQVVAKQELAAARDQVLGLNTRLAKADADLQNANTRMQEYARDLDAMQNRLKIEFENLANRILEEKSNKFTAQNQTNLEQVLGPLKTQIGEFKNRVEQVYTAETADRSALRQQIDSLKDLNQKINEEAKNLTLALKGDSKAQGNWGELILEKVLESSGLKKGTEYMVQSSLKNEDGKNLRPDVIINLPDQKHFVVDSKVSLTAYEQYCSCENSEDQKILLKEHIKSVRKHVDELAAKKYHDLYQINAPDFVFMFVPVEPAFSLALRSDGSLFTDAFEKKVILVTPTTLLATLRTVDQIWKQELQTRNALEIARKSGDLYDKFVMFYTSLEKVNSKLNETQTAFNDVFDDVKTGRGNLIKRVEDIKKLGIKASKELPSNVMQQAIETDQA